MKIRSVKISNFRGIREMEWPILGTVNCLIGPRDSTKTTVLDAIEYTLSSRWNIPFDDSDFYLSEPNNTIEIIVTLGQIPEELMREEKFGLHARGWNQKDGINDEPKEGDEHVLSVRLRVDSTLEPQWTIVNDRNKDGVKISYKDRELFGLTRLGQEVDKHLSWMRGSILSQLTSNRRDASAMLSRVLRAARDIAEFDKIDDLRNIAQKTKDAASHLGVKPSTDYKPAFDSRGITGGFGAISIHDGKIPLRLLGLGSRRLIALGLQMSCAERGSILLIDEVENALEPYAIIHLLHILQQSVNQPTAEGQVIMTSHSSIVIAELGVDKLKIVRSVNGKTEVSAVNSDLQATVRSVPESLLGRKILVCEGKTEYGICRSLDKLWTQQNGKSLAYMGVALVEGGGVPKSSQRASQLSSLGYPSCLFIDSDKLNESKPSIDNLDAAGIKVIHWDDSVSTEQRIAMDLSWNAIKDVVSLLVEWQGEESIFDPICSKLGRKRSDIGTNLDDWKNRIFNENQIRDAIGLAAKEAKDNKWFKRIDFGEELGNIIIKDWNQISGEDLGLRLLELKSWIYA